MVSVNQDPAHVLDKVKYFALDMDGTIYLDSCWIEGAKDFLQCIETLGKKYIFLTNNSSKSPQDYVEKLHRMGWDVDISQIISSGQATIFYLRQHYAGKRVFLLGNDCLKQEFREEGIVLDETAPDVVVTAFDTSLDYKKMCKVCDFVRAGLPYISTHPDYNCPTKTGFIPDVGAIHAFIQASANRWPDRVIGKPNVDIVKYLLNRLQADGDEVLMAGDRLYTDVATGCNHGLHSMLVLSGETKLEDVASSEVKPELIFDSVREVIPFLKA